MESPLSRMRSATPALPALFVVAAGTELRVTASCSRFSDLPAEASTSGARAYVNKEELGPDVLHRLWAMRDHEGMLTT